jgi:serine/threonine protein phosphatase 1
MNMVKRFARNEMGRDFVVGDVHGCFDMLREAMAVHQFDNTRDRLFSVGDLVDRGPSSSEAIDWIAQPWFHAVRGNHEQLVIGVAAGKHDQLNYAKNGGAWLLALDEDKRRRIASVLDTLPVAIEIDHARGRIGIVHADIHGDSWDAFTAELEGARSNGHRHRLTEVAMWSRSRIQAQVSGRAAAPITDIAALFVGHTRVHVSFALGNVNYIDTGAVFGNALTMLEIDAWLQPPDPSDHGEQRLWLSPYKGLDPHRQCLAD